MKKGKIFKISAVLFSLFMLTSCTAFDSNANSLLVAPKQKEIYHIQKALEDSAGENITLKYPTTGEYRSAFVLKDIDGDGNNEAFAFYSKTEEDVVTMNINVITEDEDDWSSKGSAGIAAGGIEKVVFSDLDGDGIQEIIVGWSVFASVDKQLMVYSFDGITLKKRAMEKYADFICGNLTGDSKNELIVFGINSADKTATAKVFSLKTDSIDEVGSVQLDSGITSYQTPILSTLSNSHPAVYVDAAKGVGMVTEIIWFDNDILTNIKRENLEEENITFRTTASTTQDFNHDGILDVPIFQILKSTEKNEEIDKVYVTNWSSFDGKNFKTQTSAFMNYSDGYYLAISEEFLDKLYLARKIDSRLRIFYLYDLKTETQGDEVFRIMAVDKSNYSKEVYSEQSYEVIHENDTFVYLIRVQQNNPLGITNTVLKTGFGLLK